MALSCDADGRESLEPFTEAVVSPFPMLVTAMDQAIRADAGCRGNQSRIGDPPAVREGRDDPDRRD